MPTSAEQDKKDREETQKNQMYALLLGITLDDLEEIICSNHSLVIKSRQEKARQIFGECIPVLEKEMEKYLIQCARDPHANPIKQGRCGVCDEPYRDARSICGVCGYVYREEFLKKK